MTNWNNVRDLDLPANWDMYDREGKINYLTGAMGRENLVNLLRDEFLDRPERDAATFDKDEVAQLFFICERAQEALDDE